jgi:hypothetical protein
MFCTVHNPNCQQSLVRLIEFPYWFYCMNQILYGYRKFMDCRVIRPVASKRCLDCFFSPSVSEGRKKQVCWKQTATGLFATTPKIYFGQLSNLNSKDKQTEFFIIVNSTKFLCCMPLAVNMDYCSSCGYENNNLYYPKTKKSSNIRCTCGGIGPCRGTCRG